MTSCSDAYLRWAEWTCVRARQQVRTGPVGHPAGAQRAARRCAPREGLRRTVAAETLLLDEQDQRRMLRRIGVDAMMVLLEGRGPDERAVSCCARCSLRLRRNTPQPRGKSAAAVRAGRAFGPAKQCRPRRKLLRPGRPEQNARIAAESWAAEPAGIVQAVMSMLTGRVWTAESGGRSARLVVRWSGPTRSQRGSRAIGRGMQLPDVRAEMSHLVTPRRPS